MDKEQLLASGLLEQYVLGLTDEQESSLVEEMAASHEEIRLELSLLQQAMERYAAQHTFPHEVPTEKKNAAAPPAKSHTGLLKLSGKTLWPLATAFALVWATFNALTTDIKEQQLRNLQEKYTLLENNCNKQANDRQHLAEISSFLQHRHTYKVILKGCSFSEGAFAIAYWNPLAQKGYVDAGSLPPPPHGKSYQIWADVEGLMVNAGLIRYDRDKPLQEINFIEKAASLNITLEPEGGSEEPTVALLQANGAVAMK